jgi:hypothetical protein
MPLAVTCECGKRLQAKDEYAGKQVRCPVCGNVLTLPESDSLPGPAEDRNPFSFDDREEPARQPYRPGAGLPEQIDRQPLTPDGRLRQPRNPQTGRPVPTTNTGGGWFGHVNAGVGGGLAMMAIAVIWFVVGLAVGIIFIYPPILFVIGLIAFFKGLATSNR